MSPSPEPGPIDFRTTHWSVVLLAGQSNVPGAASALEQLCRAYWYPLYAFVRRRGYNPDDAQDLVQGYFEQLLTRNDLTTVHPRKGRFRTYLLTTLTHYLSNEWDRARAAKRGGGLQFVSLESEDPEQRYQFEPAGEIMPETLFDMAWATQVLDTVLAKLKDECQSSGNAERFDALKEFLLGDRGGMPYAQIAQTLGMTEQGIKSAVHRLRQRFRELFRSEIAQTVGTLEEIDDELRYLIRVMTG